MFKAGFTKDDRSTFTYWFAHWCSFQLVALNLKVWKFKYLFHDIEKPFLKLLLPYERVQKIHRTRNSHHLEHYIEYGYADWEAMVIDWECSGLTKKAAPLDCRGEMKRVLKSNEYPSYVLTALHDNMKPILDKWKL